MCLDELFKICDGLSVLRKGDRIKVKFGDLETNWIDSGGSFTKRISPENLNRFFLEDHLKKEIEIKNILDEGVDLLNSKKYSKAIARFDEVLHYDCAYQEALISKSHALCAQGHFVKALRFFKKSNVEDDGYYRLLLKKSSDERDNFPKIKKNIYAGDEAAYRGDFKRAIEFYDRALANPSKFKNKILFKLLNKKAFALVNLKSFDDALVCFNESLRVNKNDLAYFGLGCCQYELGLDCLDSLSHACRIDKRHLLIKAEICNELGYYKDALNCFDEFFANHFALDNDFAKALQGKIVSMEGLVLDSCREKEMLSEIMDKSY